MHGRPRSPAGARVARVSTPVLVSATSAGLQCAGTSGCGSRGTLVAAEPGDDVVAVLRPRGAPRSLGAPGRGRPGGRAPAGRAASGGGPAARGRPGPAAGLVIGDTSRTPPDLTDAMLATGMTHLSAVSAAATSPSSWPFALGRCVLLGVRRRLAAARGAARARRVRRARPARAERRPRRGDGRDRADRAEPVAARGRHPGASAAVVVLLVVDPWLSRSYGFALSTLATLGLLLFTRSWGDAIGRRLPEPDPVVGAGARHSRCGTGDVRAGRRAAPGLGLRRRACWPTCSRPARRAGHRRRGRGRRWWRRLAVRGARLLCWVGALPDPRHRPGRPHLSPTVPGRHAALAGRCARGASCSPP